MIKLKIDKNKSGEPILKINSKSLTENEKVFLKIPLIESKEVKGIYNIQIPMRFFIPIINNNKDAIRVDRHSKNTYYEFSDIYDEKYYYTLEITPKYMKKWREEECPNIFKINIDDKNNTIKKEVIFKKIRR